MDQKLWNRNFTLVVVGQVASLFANNILFFALSLYVLDLTGSSAWFGSVIAIAMLPTIVLMPFGGIAADRLKKRDMMVGMDFITGLVTACVALLLFRETGNPLVTITGLLMVLAIIEAFYSPCVQASIPALQAEENLVKANAIVNQISMSANIIGPVIGGVLYGFVGLVPILLVSVFCFGCAAVMELFIQIPHQKQAATKGMGDLVRKDLSEAYQYMVKEEPNLLKLMPAIAVLNFSTSAVITVGGPYIIRILLGLSSQFYGLSTGCIALAGLLGGGLTALLADRLQLKNTYKMLIYAGVSLAPLCVASVLDLPAMAMFVIMTICFMAIQVFASIFSILAMSAVQIRTPAHLIGKLMALITTIAICAEPLGRSVYGFAFELLAGRVEVVLLATALITVALGYSAKGPLKRMG